MTFCRLMLGRVIIKIAFSFFPVDMKLIFLLSTTNPIKLHVHGFASELYDGVGDDSIKKIVVELNYRWSLFVAYFM